MRSFTYSLLVCVAIFAAPRSDAQDIMQPASRVADRFATTPQTDARVTPAACAQCGCKTASCRCHTRRTKKCCAVCDPCDYVCCPETKKIDVEKDCWNVSCEPVCVPAFKWPWECCCKPKCGRVRCVNVLEKETYECKECVTEWKVKRVCGVCGVCCQSCAVRCGDGFCAGVEAKTQASVQTESAELPTANKGQSGASRRRLSFLERLWK